MTMDTTAGSELRDQDRADAAVYEQGFVAGAIGAAVVALWFLAVDAVNGRPLFTPNVLGTALFRGIGTSATEIPISFEMVFVFTWVHLLVFLVIGLGASLLLDLAERNRNFGFGIVLLFVVFEFGFVALCTLVAEPVLDALTMPLVLLGNLFAAAAMGAYFWRRHPRLVILP